jgi:hypothetical protein
MACYRDSYTFFLLLEGEGARKRRRLKIGQTNDKNGKGLHGKEGR